MSNIIPWLPHLIASCNLATFMLLVLGFIAIRKGDENTHKQFMVAALGVSLVFLILYLTYHATVGNVAFAGEGVGVRRLYFAILISHVVLATVMLPLVPLTLIKAFRGMRAEHRRLAHKTFPVWIYVSISGIVVYVMAFHVFLPG